MSAMSHPTFALPSSRVIIKPGQSIGGNGIGTVRISAEKYQVMNVPTNAPAHYTKMIPSIG